MGHEPPPTIRRFDDPRAFLAAAGPFLARHEAEHTVPIDVAIGLARQPAFYAPNPYLAVAELGGEAVAAAVMTPPHNLSLSLTNRPQSTEQFTHDLAGWPVPPPGVTGPKAVAAAFAEHWRASAGVNAVPGMFQRLFRLERVVPVADIPGSLRRATEADRDLLFAWTAAFTAEALAHAEPARIARAVDLRLRDEESGFYFWLALDGQPVAMVGYGGATPNGIRIAPVYTPPALRNRGCGAAATAAASQALLDEGRRFCCLFTDLANPAANHLYRKIGYQPLLDFDEYRFVP